MMPRMQKILDIGSPAYRSSVAVGFLYEFLSPLVDTLAEIPGGWCNGYNSAVSHVDSNSIIKENYDKFNGIKFPALLSSSKRVIQSSKEYHPVGQPITKTGAAIQASANHVGEVIFVDDIPSPRNCLYGAFIYSTEPLARVKGIKFKSGSPLVGVTALISVKDIPGKNVGSAALFGDVFADELAQCARDQIAFVVGDFSKGMAEADHQILSAENCYIKLGSQYYFYMETQTALSVSDEDNSMVVYSSNQCPEFANDTIINVLVFLQNNIRVITRRVGGFGGRP